MDAPSIPYNSATSTSDALLVTLSSGELARVTGWSVMESTGSGTAKVILRDGTDATGTALAHFTLGPNESVREPANLRITTGIYVDRITGTTDITAYAVTGV